MKEGREKERKSAWFWFKIFATTFSFSFFFLFLLGSRRWDGKYLCKLCLTREMSIQWLFSEGKYNEDGLGEFMMTPTHRKQWKILNIWSKSQGIIASWRHMIESFTRVSYIFLKLTCISCLPLLLTWKPAVINTLNPCIRKKVRKMR